MASIVMFYYGVKTMFLLSLVRAQIISESLQRHTVFLSLIYAVAVGFLSFLLLFSWQQPVWPVFLQRLAANVHIAPFFCWLIITFGVAYIYFKLLARFDEGIMFVILVLAAVPISLFV